jgi:hypothetical protein
MGKKTDCKFRLCFLLKKKKSSSMVLAYKVNRLRKIRCERVCKGLSKKDLLLLCPKVGTF